MDFWTNGKYFHNDKRKEAAVAALSVINPPESVEHFQEWQQHLRRDDQEAYLIGHETCSEPRRPGRAATHRRAGGQPAGRHLAPLGTAGRDHDALKHVVIHGLDAMVPLGDRRYPPAVTVQIVLEDLRHPKTPAE